MSSNVIIYPLGAGQDVGRSCIIVKIFDKTIMLDTGLHMGKQDKQKYPDFEKLVPENEIETVKQQQKEKQKDIYNKYVDLVLISHFHLDHCGALPHFTEIHGYSGPIYMTTPTKALLPYMLEDCRKVLSEQNKDKHKKYLDEKERQKLEKHRMNQLKPEEEQKKNENSEDEDEQDVNLFEKVFDQEDVKRCFKKTSTIQLHETVEVDGIKIKAYYAGHVLGACMFLIEYKQTTVLYTGDYNSNADRHLGAAYIDKVFPDVMITETTYATTIRDSKRERERNFLQQVQETIDKGGKVLIPVFALGRAQELCILLETYWNRVKNKVPIYFSAGLIEKANFYYKLFVNWTNENIKANYLTENMFNFKNITSFDKSLMRANTPMVLFATPGMLHGGTSVTVFKEWCHEPKNTLIIPGYCVPGTLGNKLLSGNKNINMDGKKLDIQMTIKNMSFSAHADAKGILGLIRHCEPKNVVFVHGEKGKMEILKKNVEQQFNIPVFMPANFETAKIKIEKGPLEELYTNQEVPKDRFISGTLTKKLKLDKMKKQSETQQKLNILDQLDISSNKNKMETEEELNQNQNGYYNEKSHLYNYYYHFEPNENFSQEPQQIETVQLAKLNYMIPIKKDILLQNLKINDDMNWNENVVNHLKQIYIRLINKHQETKNQAEQYEKLPKLHIFANKYLLIEVQENIIEETSKILDLKQKQEQNEIIKKQIKIIYVIIQKYIQKNQSEQ